jgi:ATP-dependent DNA ligase
MRLHPAESRIRRLAQETPAAFVAFDCLLRKLDEPLLERSFEERRAALEAFFVREHVGMSLTPFTRDLRKAKTWLVRRQLALDGVIAKRLDLPYRPGERAMLKVKRLRTAVVLSGASVTRARSAWWAGLL